MSGIMSVINGGGASPIPVGTLNGLASLPQIVLTNAAIANGTINARVVSTGAITANTLATILNLSGRGVISFLAVSPGDAATKSHRFKITLDGVVIFDATSVSATGATRVFPAIGGVITVDSGGPYLCVVPDPLFFTTSLLVEYASSVSETNIAQIGYKYFAR